MGDQTFWLQRKPSPAVHSGRPSTKHRSSSGSLPDESAADPLPRFLRRPANGDDDDDDDDAMETGEDVPAVQRSLSATLPSERRAPRRKSYSTSHMERGPAARAADDLPMDEATDAPHVEATAAVSATASATEAVADAVADAVACTASVAQGWPHETMPAYLPGLMCGIIEVEFMRRAEHIYRSLCGKLTGCVICNADCPVCVFCGSRICPLHKAAHLETHCLMVRRLPAVAADEAIFSIDTLAVLIRKEAAPNHPPGAPLCCTGDILQNSHDAGRFMRRVHELMCDAFPPLTSLPDETVHAATAVCQVCDCAAGLAAFASLEASRVQRGQRFLALGPTLTTCCPPDLVIAPPLSNSSWRLLQCSYNNPNKKDCPPCSNGHRCVGASIRTVENTFFGRCLPAMRSPHAELASETSAEPGLCILCLTLVIAGDASTSFLWRDPDGMYLPQYAITKKEAKRE